MSRTAWRLYQQKDELGAEEEQARSSLPADLYAKKLLKMFAQVSASYCTGRVGGQKDGKLSPLIQRRNTDSEKGLMLLGTGLPLLRTEARELTPGEFYLCCPAVLSLPPPPMSRY